MTTHNISVELGGVRLKNPVMTASGTFGSGMEFSEFFDLNRLGAVVTKGVSSVPWEGNPTPRICETPAGMLNAIGLQNPGFEVFAKRDLKFLEETLIPDRFGQTGTIPPGIGTKVTQTAEKIFGVLSTSAATRKKNTQTAWRSLRESTAWTFWRSIFPARTSKRAASPSGPIRREWSGSPP